MADKKLIKLLAKYFVLVFYGLSLFFYSPVLTQANTDMSQNFRLGEFLVKFINNEKIYKIKIDQNLDPLEIREKFKAKGEIEYIEPNYLFNAVAFPNDPEYSKQWYLKTINAREAWSKELLIREQEGISQKSVIAILDTGVDLGHVDLKDKIWVNSREVANDSIDNDRNGYIDDVYGWDFVSNDKDPKPSFDSGFSADAVNHGTIVSGIAAASSNNEQGITGVSWSSQIMSLRVLDSQGLGDVYDVIRAIDYAIAKGADVINMSFVGTSYSTPLAEAIRRAYDRGVIVVAAAGNTDPKVNGVDLDLSKSYPVCYEGASGENIVVGVGSIANTLKKSDFSNYGGCVDLMAPGESFYSTQVYNPAYGDFATYYNGYWSGTSLSAPLVSGTFGLIKALRPNFSASELIRLVFESAKDVDVYNPAYKGKLGSGQVDSFGALEAVLGQRLSKEEGGKNNYLIAGLGVGSFPQLKVLNDDGTEFKSFYAYSPHFNGAINVAAGDVNDDDVQEIITGAGAGGGPHVRIFDIEGYVKSQFFAYDQNFRGGVNIATGDINGDGVDEIITGPGRGNKPEVKIFDYQGNLINKFLAYTENFTGGVKVASGDIDQDGKDDIITGAGAGGGPHVRVFSPVGELISQFFAYNQNFRGGINIAVGDLHGDGKPEIIASVEKNSLPTVRVFDYRGNKLSEFFAYDLNFLSGVYVAAGDFDNDGLSEIITGPGIGGGSHIKVFNLFGKVELELFAYNLDYLGGVRPGVLIH